MENQSLYALTNARFDVLAMLAEESDPTTIADTLDSIDCAIEEKAANIVRYTRSLDARADAIKAEEKRLTERRKAIENHIERLKKYLLDSLVLLDKPKIESDLFTIAVQANPPAVQIEDEKLIPAKYQIVIPATYQIDKKAIADALKAGEKVPGCQLTQGRRLSIR